tara:strand:+ start:2862 stop:3980 length:1119 start_codon:yes stop_codon:yes gene_type:complete
VNKQKIYYITYQTFPADTANSQQTISNIKYLIKNNCDVTLVFPLREMQSSSDPSVFREKYGFKEKLEILGLPHNYPFGKVTILNKVFFHLSHFLWSKKAVNNILQSQKEVAVFFTRSDWVLYFLSKRNKKVIFECHQISKIRTLILKNALKKSTSKVIFLNKYLREYFGSHANNKNSLILNNGVDLEEFQKKSSKKKEIIFVGNLDRFNEDRGIEFIIEGYSRSKISDRYKLKIIGGPNHIAKELAKKIENENESLNIKITGRLGRDETVKNIITAEAGILLNTSDNQHSVFYTSPLKYFEYLINDLKIIGVDFPSHRALPYSEDITFFQENNLNSLINGFNKLLDKDIVLKESKEFSLDTRAKNIINFINI